MAGAPESQANAQNTPWVFSVSDFSALDSCLRHEPQVIASIVIDLERVVDRICDRAPMPLLTVIDEAHEFEKRARIK